MWYNQQRFINQTIATLCAINEQLRSMSLMAMQNRFVLDTLLAEDQGVCDYFGDECCAVISMHTGQEGNLTKMLKTLKVI